MRHRIRQPILSKNRGARNSCRSRCGRSADQRSFMNSTIDCHKVHSGAGIGPLPIKAWPCSDHALPTQPTTPLRRWIAWACNIYRWVGTLIKMIIYYCQGGMMNIVQTQVIRRVHTNTAIRSVSVSHRRSLVVLPTHTIHPQ